MKRFAPGVYYDEAQDAIHIVADELLAAHGYAATPANLAIVRDIAREVCAEQYPDAPVVEEGFPT